MIEIIAEEITISDDIAAGEIVNVEVAIEGNLRGGAATNGSAALMPRVVRRLNRVASVFSAQQG